MDVVAAGALADPAPGMAGGRGIPQEGCKKWIMLLSVCRNNWTEAFWKLNSSRLLRGELPLTPFYRTWLKTWNLCKKLVVSWSPGWDVSVFQVLNLARGA